MRILNLISSKGLFGAERVLLELSKSLLKADSCYPIVGVIKNAYNPHIEVADEARRCNVDTVIFPCSGRFDFQLVSLIGKYLESKKIDIVHCHGYKSNIFGLLAAKKKIPTVTTNHNWLTSHWRLKIYCLLDSLWIRYFDRVVAVSENVKKDMLRYRIPEKKIHIIDNGIDLDRFKGRNPAVEMKKKLCIKENDKIIGTIGSLGNEKGHIFLLKAAREILKIDKTVKFLIVGDGPLRLELERYTRETSIDDNVIFTGYRHDIENLLSIIDIFVLPSIKEGLPMVILEAMASVKPVIATRVGAISNVIQHGTSGILIEAGNVLQLQQSIERLLSDKKLSDRIASQGHMAVEKRYSSQRMCENYLNLYKGLIAHGIA